MHLQTPFKEGASFLKKDMLDLVVKENSARVNVLIESLRLPLCTPPWVKYTNESICESGRFGRCFCVGRNRGCDQLRSEVVEELEGIIY